MFRKFIIGFALFLGISSVGIAATPPVFTSGAPTAGTVGTPYSFPFTATGSPSPNFSLVVPNNQPPGLTISKGGVFSGTPKTAGTFTFAVRAKNSAGQALSPPAGTHTLIVSAAATPTALPVFTNGNPTYGAVGTPYSFTFTATGLPAPTFTLATGTLPAGLSLSSSGILSGTPTTATTYTFKVNATNSSGVVAQPASGSHSVIISPSGAVTSVEGYIIPNPSKIAKQIVPDHIGAKGAGATINAWSVNPSRCSNTSPAITSSWHHNIDFADHGNKMNQDFFDMAANEALTYQFTASQLGTGQVLITDQTSYPLVSTFMSLSTTPCDFDITKLVSPGRNYCYSALPLDNTLAYEITSGAITFPTNCKLTPGVTYYLNLRFHNGSSAADTCAPRGTRCGGILQIRAGAVTSPTAAIVDVGGRTVPSPVSKVAQQSGAIHAGPMGGGDISYGEIRGWSIPVTSCTNALPAITTLWYHNIDLYAYGLQNALDKFNFAAYEAVSYGFIAPALPAPTYAVPFPSIATQIFMTTGSQGTPASTFLSISSTPCDFSVQKFAISNPCYATGGTENGISMIVTNALTSPVCKLTPGSKYYINVRFQDARPGTNSTIDSCASALAYLGQPNGTCGFNMQIHTY